MYDFYIFFFLLSFSFSFPFFFAYLFLNYCENLFCFCDKGGNIFQTKIQREIQGELMSLSGNIFPLGTMAFPVLLLLGEWPQHWVGHVREEARGLPGGYSC